MDDGCVLVVVPDVPPVLRELCRTDGNMGNDDPCHQSVVWMMLSVRRYAMGLKLQAMQKNVLPWLLNDTTADRTVGRS